MVKSRIYFNAPCKENIMHFCTFFDAKFNQSFFLKRLTLEVPLPIKEYMVYLSLTFH